MSSVRHFAKRVIWKAWQHATPEVTLKTKQGRLTVSTRDYAIGRELFLNGEHEFTFSRRCIALLHDGGYLRGPVTLLDVGANIGHIGIGLLLCGDVTNVIAIEPEPKNYQLLKRNVAQNAVDVETMNVAAATERGVVPFSLHPWNYGDHHVASGKDTKTFDVPAIPLDDIRTPVSLMWIDVQGYEGFAFRGAKKLLCDGLPTVSEVAPFCIKRAGMSVTEFVEICRGFWTHFFVDQHDRFVKHNMRDFDTFVRDLGDLESSFANVAFVNDANPR